MTVIISPFGATRARNACTTPTFAAPTPAAIGLPSVPATNVVVVIFVIAVVVLALPHPIPPSSEAIASTEGCGSWLSRWDGDWSNGSETAHGWDNKMSLISCPLRAVRVVVPLPFLWRLAVVTTVLSRGWWLCVWVFTLCWWPPSWPRGASRAPQRISFL